MPERSVLLRSGDAAVDRCHALALETLDRNTKPFRDGLLDAPVPCFLAGESYDTPWTRDCAYNVWNAGALLDPEAAHNTLLSVLLREDGSVRIGGQYWDAVAWVVGAWHYVCVTGDRDFLPLALEATANSLGFFERTEFDPATGLFMGPASYGDGVASYPEPYNDAGGSSGILDYPAAHPEIGKIRMKCLSTNCLYYGAYGRAAEMARALGRSERTDEWQRKAQALRDRINEHLWLAGEGRYGYFLGHDNELVAHMEGLGQSLAVLLQVADEDRAARLLSAQHVTPYGIPCVWPVFPRFQSPDGMSFGRHNGTVWPFIQGYWAEAAARHGRLDLFDRELTTLTTAVDRVANFYEIFHPLTGEPYGGLQIDHGAMRLWDSCPRQTWSATGYLRMIHQVLVGMDFVPDGLRFRPAVPERFGDVTLEHVPYRAARLDIRLRGRGTAIRAFHLDGERLDTPCLPADLRGSHRVELDLAG